jgi:hypothetical protein
VLIVSTLTLAKNYNPEWRHSFTALNVKGGELFELAIFDWNKRSPAELVQTIFLSVQKLYEDFRQPLPGVQQATDFETMIPLNNPKKPSSLKLRFHIEWPQELRGLSADEKLGRDPQ